MADLKITQLTENTAPLGTDLLANVKDPSGTPVTDKVTIANVLSVAHDGWKLAGTFTYSSADAPTYVVTVASGAASIYNVGDRIKLTDSGVKYFIITSVADTSLTLYGGTDYALTGGAITLPYYSHQKGPLGFPLNPAKWTQSVYDNTARPVSTPTNGTWYNLSGGSLTIPIGSWDLEHSATIYGFNNATPKGFSISITLSTANNSESDTNFSGTAYTSYAASSYNSFGINKRKHVLLASKTVYYSNMLTNSANVTEIGTNSSDAHYIRAVCAYL